MSQIFQKLFYRLLLGSSFSNAFVKLPNFSITCRIIRNAYFPLERQTYTTSQLSHDPDRTLCISEGVKERYPPLACMLGMVKSFHGSNF